MGITGIGVTGAAGIVADERNARKGFTAPAVSRRSAWRSEAEKIIFRSGRL
jgi:hypothetical protein